MKDYLPLFFSLSPHNGEDNEARIPNLFKKKKEKQWPCGK